MKHLKYFENNDVYFGVGSGSHTGLFEIDNGVCCLELLQEDLDAIREILIDKKYNTYNSEVIGIYLYNDTLTIFNSDSDDEININSVKFNDLLSRIQLDYNNVPDFEEWTGNKLEELDVQKIFVEDFVRTSKKYNL